MAKKRNPDTGVYRIVDVVGVSETSWEDAGRRAEPTHAFLDSVGLGRVNEPDEAVGHQGVRGHLQFRPLGRDPADAEAELVDYFHRRAMLESMGMKQLLE